MAQFAETADRLHPPKALLDEFPSLLTEGIAAMAGGAAVDHTATTHGAGYCARCGMAPIARRPATKSCVSWPLSAATVIRCLPGQRFNHPGRRVTLTIAVGRVTVVCTISPDRCSIRTCPK
jgi:hypothetical protein